MYHNTDKRTTEELLKENAPFWYYDRTDRNGTRYFLDCKCHKCNGRGVIEYYYYVDSGVCFDCGGSGRNDSGFIVKIYTEEHAQKLEQQADARKEKAKQEREEKAIRERGNNLIKAGFGLEDGEYVIYRVVGNTFPIKDQLKEFGCRFNPTVGWFSNHLLEEYETQRMIESEVLKESIYVSWKDKKEVENLFIENIRRLEEATSMHVGNIGDKITVSIHIDRFFENINNFNHHSTVSYTYLMHDEQGNQYRWTTAKSFESESDHTFSGLVKDHKDYKGVPYTVLTRCKEIVGV